MIRLDRSRRSDPDRFLYVKLALFFLGAGFFVAGVTTGRDWAVVVTIGVLFVALVLRLVSRGREDGEVQARDEDEAPPED
ncbi:MAG TPA: hypothetical protein VHG28_01295 [Longimicrobiaceae bacterium]|nr:hypothetical protein [Longimicrobiaceae bacterium]